MIDKFWCFYTITKYTHITHTVHVSGRYFINNFTPNNNNNINNISLVVCIALFTDRPGVLTRNNDVCSTN